MTWPLCHVNKRHKKLSEMSCGGLLQRRYLQKSVSTVFYVLPTVVPAGPLSPRHPHRVTPHPPTADWVELRLAHTVCRLITGFVSAPAGPAIWLLVSACPKRVRTEEKHKALKLFFKISAKWNYFNLMIVKTPNYIIVSVSLFTFDFRVLSVNPTLFPACCVKESALTRAYAFNFLTASFC